MFHRVTLIGHVGQDPQMRYTPDGTPVTNISVATRTSLSKDTQPELPGRVEGIVQRQGVGADHLVAGDLLAQAGRDRQPICHQRDAGLC